MKSALALAFAYSVVGELYTSDESSQRSLFEKFKLDFKRNYSNETEEKTRFQYFLENLKLADQRQRVEDASNGDAKHGITIFSDWSQVSIMMCLRKRSYSFYCNLGGI